MSDVLKFRMLPTSLLIKNFVENDSDSNYEKYLVEFINSSPFFLEKSNNQMYVHSEKQSNGECDCVSDRYKIDFKLLISQSMAQSKNLFSRSICQSVPGIIIYGPPKKLSTDKDYKEIKATSLVPSFRGISVDELFEIAISSDQSIEKNKDIKSVLNAVDTQKHILCMLPYEYVSNNEEDYSIQETRVIETISQDFQSLAHYRMRMQPKYDTYISFVYRDSLIILQYTARAVLVVDKIPLKKSGVFQKLQSIANPFE